MKTIRLWFWGTSNLWHGVISDFDDIDWQNNNLETNTKASLRASLSEQTGKLKQYFGSVEELYKITPKDLKSTSSLILGNKLKIKKY